MNQFMNYNKQFRTNKKRPKIAFTANEDELISFLVNRIGTQKWGFISKFVVGRTAKQCRDRYMNYLKPGLTNNQWTKNEDDQLQNLYSKFGARWSLINRYFRNRNQVSLKNRLKFLQNYNKDDLLHAEKNEITEKSVDVNDKKTKNQSISSEKQNEEKNENVFDVFFKENNDSSLLNDEDIFDHEDTADLFSLYDNDWF